MSKDLGLTADELAQAIEAINREGGQPKDVWVPRYGWIIRDGKPTLSGLAWRDDQAQASPGCED